MSGDSAEEIKCAVYFISSKDTAISHYDDTAPQTSVSHFCCQFDEVLQAAVIAVVQAALHNRKDRRWVHTRPTTYAEDLPSRCVGEEQIDGFRLVWIVERFGGVRSNDDSAIAQRQDHSEWQANHRRCAGSPRFTAHRFWLVSFG